ncbi:hypothetical protein NM688_g7645 [Phlebia brevispora]|uniref:Uncharacterized protein n=1 Tax=Phlebia brevispora TaxID=194682 RepID=A0ACC1S323_9APHY|nr:hypothetical protein NM688_g7645 [Phlebia brevispora]
MERVQFQQEQMLAELKDLVQKGLFTQQEVKQIMKRRTAFETALVRRVAKKNDYLRYAAYEMGLEALRKKRVERLKLPRSTPSVSDFALVRRQFHIFERALKKFKSDVALWIQYIQVAKKEGARSLVGRICARALQLHPNVPQLYILAASHELSHLSPTAARALLQRGIRLNSESVEMWREYVKMEMGFVEGMRRRWGVLGIEMKGKEKARGSMEDGMEENEVAEMQHDADGKGDDAEQARRQILEGAIVKSVIAHAPDYSAFTEALPQVELFTALHNLILTYPAPEPFRTALLDHLHDLLKQTLPADPTAVRLAITRTLTPGLTGAALVDGLKDANENLTKAVEQASREDRNVVGMGATYAEFVQEWVQKSDLDDSIKLYLLTSLHALIQRLSKKKIALPPLMSMHLRLLASQRALVPQLPYVKILSDLPAHYASTIEGQKDADLWISRLEFERSDTEALRDGARIEQSWREARAAVQGPDILRVWTWGVPSEEEIEDEEKVKAALNVLEELLRESMRMQDAPSFRTIHDELLFRSAAISKHLVSSTARLAQFRRLTNSYLPNAPAFEAFFLSESALSPEDASQDVLKEVYQAWRRRDVVAASLAAEVSASDSLRQQLEEGWAKVLQDAERGEANVDGDGDQEMADA